ncbi:MAG: hypothetical protein ACP5I8_04405 [Phycisphaerae bacterium]
MLNIFSLSAAMPSQSDLQNLHYITQQVEHFYSQTWSMIINIIFILLAVMALLGSLATIVMPVFITRRASKDIADLKLHMEEELAKTIARLAEFQSERHHRTALTSELHAEVYEQTGDYIEAALFHMLAATEHKEAGHMEPHDKQVLAARSSLEAMIKELKASAKIEPNRLRPRFATIQKDCQILISSYTEPSCSEVRHLAEEILSLINAPPSPSTFPKTTTART